MSLSTPPASQGQSAMARNTLSRDAVAINFPRVCAVAAAALGWGLVRVIDDFDRLTPAQGLAVDAWGLLMLASDPATPASSAGDPS